MVQRTFRTPEGTIQEDYPGSFYELITSLPNPEQNNALDLSFDSSERTSHFQDDSQRKALKFAAWLIAISTREIHVHVTLRPSAQLSRALQRHLPCRIRARIPAPPKIRGEVRFDSGIRALYATDASNYRQLPIGVVLPLDAADVEATVAACRKFARPSCRAAAGTSLAGQCCNVAVVLDFSKYMSIASSISMHSVTSRASSPASCSIACAKPPSAITSPSLPIPRPTAAAPSAA